MPKIFTNYKQKYFNLKKDKKTILSGFQHYKDN